MCQFPWWREPSFPAAWAAGKRVRFRDWRIFGDVSSRMTAVGMWDMNALAWVRSDRQVDSFRKVTRNQDESKNASKRSRRFASRLDRREQDLPWTNLIFFGTSANVQRAVVIGRDDVCSRAVNGCTGRGIGARVIAVKRVGRGRPVGVVVRPATSIERARRVGNAGVNKVGVIGSGSESG